MNRWRCVKVIDMTYGDVIDENLLNEFTEDQKEKN